MNTVDNTPPVSQVSALPSASTCPAFQVNWSGTDVGSGVAGFTIHVSVNGGPFTAWLSNTTAANATYIGADGNTYAFYSIASDLVGNLEPGKTQAEATTSVSAADTCGPPILSAEMTNIAQSGNTVTASLQLTNTGFTAAQTVNSTRYRCAVSAVPGPSLYQAPPSRTPWCLSQSALQRLCH